MVTKRAETDEVSVHGALLRALRDYPAEVHVTRPAVSRRENRRHPAQAIVPLTPEAAVNMRGDPDRRDVYLFLRLPRAVIEAVVRGVAQDRRTAEWLTAGCVEDEEVAL